MQMAIDLMAAGGTLSDDDLAKTTATAGTVLKGKTFYAGDDTLKTGTLPNLAASPSNGGQAYTYLNNDYKGVGVSYDKDGVFWLTTNGDGVKRFCLRPPYGAFGGSSLGIGGTDGYVGIEASKLGNATNGQVLSGATFSSQNDIGVSGTMANNGSWSKSLGFGETVTVPAGYHSGGGTITGPRWNGDKYLYLAIQFQDGYGAPIPEHVATVVALGASPEPGFLAHYLGRGTTTVSNDICSAGMLNINASTGEWNASITFIANVYDIFNQVNYSAGQTVRLGQAVYCFRFR